MLLPVWKVRKKVEGWKFIDEVFPSLKVPLLFTDWKIFVDNYKILSLFPEIKTFDLK